MKSITPALAILSLIVISGCSSGGDDMPETVPVTTDSMQFSPTSSADFDNLVDDATVDLSNKEDRPNNRRFQNAQAFSRVGYGSTPEGITYFAYAGLDQTSPLNGSIVTTGSINYYVNYGLYEVRGTVADPEDIQYQSGTLLLAANFDDNTITGESELFTVNGTLTDGSQDFDADVTWRGVAGDMDGKVTTIGVVGAFQGSSDDTVYAGTLTGRPQPE